MSQQSMSRRTRTTMAAVVAAGVCAGPALTAHSAPANSAPVAAAAVTTAVTSQPDLAAQAALATAAVRDATYRTALTGWVPSLSKTYGFRSGRMVNGRLPKVSQTYPTSQVQIKDIDHGRTWQRRSIRFVDVAGNRGKEVAVIISANAGGVSWPNYVFVYDARGRILMNWYSGKYHGDAREGVSFGTATRTSVAIRVNGIPRANEPSCCGTGKATWLLKKGKSGKLRMTRTS